MSKLPLQAKSMSLLNGEAQESAVVVDEEDRVAHPIPLLVSNLLLILCHLIVICPDTADLISSLQNTLDSSKNLLLLLH